LTLRLTKTYRIEKIAALNSDENSELVNGGLGKKNFKLQLLIIFCYE